MAQTRSAQATAPTRSAPSVIARGGTGPWRRIAQERWMYLFIIPGALYFLVFAYLPLLGNVIAFKDYSPFLGILESPWAGLENFRKLVTDRDFHIALANTLKIELLQLAFAFPAPLLLALVLNSIISERTKRGMQSLVYLPHFLSWIVLGGILLDILAPAGLVNRPLVALGLKPVLFLGSNAIFQPTLIFTNLWKEVGWATIIYLAALMSIDPGLHEAAAIDGADRLRRILHVNLPGISSVVILIACLNLGNVLQAGFEQVLILYNPLVYASGDILDTYVYRAGLISAQYSLAGAVGLLKSVLSFVLIVLAYRLATRFSGYRIF